jgi:hypothetical protein
VLDVFCCIFIMFLLIGSGGLWGRPRLMLTKDVYILRICPGGLQGGQICNRLQNNIGYDL